MTAPSVACMQRRVFATRLGSALPPHTNYGELGLRIREIFEECPTAFNAQDTAVAILFGHEHQAFWQYIHALPTTSPSDQAVIESSLFPALGTVVLLENEKKLKLCQWDNQLYMDQLPTYAEQSSGMAEFAIWVGLSQEGLGATALHYQPAIEGTLARLLHVPEHCTIQSQLVFGSVEETANAVLPTPDAELFTIRM